MKIFSYIQYNTWRSFTPTAREIDKQVLDSWLNAVKFYATKI